MTCREGRWLKGDRTEVVFRGNNPRSEESCAQVSKWEWKLLVRGNSEVEVNGNPSEGKAQLRGYGRKWKALVSRGINTGSAPHLLCLGARLSKRNDSNNDPGVEHGPWGSDYMRTLGSTECGQNYHI